MTWLARQFGFGKTAAQKQAVRARYDSAQTTNENEPLWVMTDYLSAKAANSYQVRRTLKIRSRYESANNSYFRGIIDTIANDLIGSGPRLQARTKDQSANRQLQDAWHQWARAIGLANKLRVMAKSKTGDGEAFGLLVTNQNLRGTLGGSLDVDDSVQLDLAVIESDQVTTPAPTFDEQMWVDGMTLDQLGNPILYHVLRVHPGDLFMPTLNPLTYDSWKPQHVVHWFRQDRPGQVRGIPEITPALDLFAQLRRFTKAVLTAAETAADIAAYLETNAPANTDGTDESFEPFDKLRLERGLMLTLPANTKIAQLAAQQPATTYEMFVKLLLREICRCLGIPLNIAMGDSSTYNYSSGRLDHLSYHRQQRIDRTNCVESVLDKIFRAWLDEAAMIPGLLPAGLSYEHIPHRWFWDTAESIDPVKDASAENMRLASGTQTLSAIFAERGEDWETAIRQSAKEIALKFKLAAEMGIPVETLGVKPAEVAASLKPNKKRRRERVQA